MASTVKFNPVSVNCEWTISKDWKIHFNQKTTSRRGGKSTTTRKKGLGQAVSWRFTSKAVVDGTPNQVVMSVKTGSQKAKAVGYGLRPGLLDTKSLPDSIKVALPLAKFKEDKGKAKARK